MAENRTWFNQYELEHIKLFKALLKRFEPCVVNQIRIAPFEIFVKID